MKKLISLGKEFGKGLGARKLALYSAASTYNIFISMVPVIMLMVSLIRFLPVSQEYIIARLGEMMPEQVMTVLGRIITGIYQSGKAAFTVSIILTVYSASASMRELMKGLDAAYDVEKTGNIIKYYGSSILYMVVFVITLLLSFVAMAYGGKIMSIVSGYFPDIAILKPVFSVLKYARYLLIMAFLFAVFLIMYTFVPSGKRKIRNQLPGALFASAAWVIFSVVFSVYISFSDKFGAYGVIGTVMVAMMWLYYSIFFLLIGGWLNCFVAEKKEDAAEAEEEKENEPCVG